MMQHLIIWGCLAAIAAGTLHSPRWVLALLGCVYVVALAYVIVAMM